MPNTYIDFFQYQRSPSGLETASLLGNSMRLSTTANAGALALNNTPNLVVQLNLYDPVTIFDGPNSEVVLVAATAAAGNSSFTIQAPGLQFQHAAGTPMCSNGVLGSLADQIVDACAWLEADFTYQPLFAATYTETLPMPSMQASIDTQNMLLFRPKHFPVTAVSAISIAAIQGQGMVLDATQAFIDANQQYVRVPVLNATGPASQVYFPQMPFNRQQQQWLTITYTAGFVPSALPADIRDAAVLLTSVILSRRQNPTGADQIDFADKKLVATLRGDNTGEGLLVKEARHKLRRYKVLTI